MSAETGCNKATLVTNNESVFAMTALETKFSKNLGGGDRYSVGCSDRLPSLVGLFSKIKIFYGADLRKRPTIKGIP